MACDSGCWCVCASFMGKSRHSLINPIAQLIVPDDSSTTRIDLVGSCCIISVPKCKSICSILKIIKMPAGVDRRQHRHPASQHQPVDCALWPPIATMSLDLLTTLCTILLLSLLVFNLCLHNDAPAMHFPCVNNQRGQSACQCKQTALFGQHNIPTTRPNIALTANHRTSLSS